MQIELLTEKLNNTSTRKRLKALKKLNVAKINDSDILENNNSNICFKTVYSSYYYTPSLAVYSAYKNGISVVGITDNCSLLSIDEFIKASSMLQLDYYCGVEVRSKYVLDDKLKKISLCAYGIPHKLVKKFDRDLEPYRSRRQDYVDKLKKRLNDKFKAHKITISNDDLQRSKYGRIGCVKVNILYTVLASKIMSRFIDEQKLISFLIDDLHLKLEEEDKTRLSDFANAYYEYDLAEILRNYLNVNVDEDMFDIKHFVELCNKYSSICAFVYENKKFSEDEAISIIKKYNLKAVVLNVKRLDEQEAGRLYDKFLENDILPIGRYSAKTLRSKFDNTLTDKDIINKFRQSTYAIVGHEMAICNNLEDGMFSSNNVLDNSPSLVEKINVYSRTGAKGKTIILE